MMEDTVLTLSNKKKYFVVDQLNIKGTEYYYLCSIDKPVEIKLAMREDHQIKFLNEPDIMNYIYNQFVEHMKQSLNEE